MVAPALPHDSIPSILVRQKGERRCREQKGEGPHGTMRALPFTLCAVLPVQRNLVRGKLTSPKYTAARRVDMSRQFKAVLLVARRGASIASHAHSERTA